MAKTLLFFALLLQTLTTLSNAFISPMQCSNPSLNVTCNSALYVSPNGLSPAAVALRYSANASLIRNITRPLGPDPDFLVQVPCKCENDGNGTIALFHDTNYTVQPGDTLNGVITNVFDGLAWIVGVGDIFPADQVTTVRLPCGCYQGNPKVEVVSYAVQKGDTMTAISSLFQADAGEIQKLNAKLIQNPESLVVGWVLFVPMDTAAPPS